MNLIKLKDYERMFRVISSVISLDLTDLVNRGHTHGTTLAESCVFYSVYGAFLLKKYYNLPAMPVIGAVTYPPLPGHDELLVIGDCDIKDDPENPDNMILSLSSSIDHFHCWIDTGEGIIDFGATAITAEKRAGGRPIMMQKSYASIEEEPGWSFSPNEELKYIFGQLAERDIYTDYAKICMMWFEKSPKKMQKYIHGKNEKGENTEIPLYKTRILSAW